MESFLNNNKSKKVTRLILFPFVTLLLTLSSCYYDKEEALYLVRPGTSNCDTASPTYSLTIQPIIQHSCQGDGCHSGTTPANGLDLTIFENVKSAVNNKHLLAHVKQNGYSIMPPSGSLSDCNINELDAWITKGMPVK